MQKILIINTGGTFNKEYNQFNGYLEVRQDNLYVESLCQESCIDPSTIQIKGLLYKDSLEMNNDDRKQIVTLIQQQDINKVIIIHGTDTMNETALFLSKQNLSKQIVLTGAMKPYSINKIEATGNFLMAIGFLNHNVENNIYISMHGKVKTHTLIYKNRQKGLFECH